jgi:sterol desaturase/sphingolipid hydroxylase (fatty acid hydroxylase superfamily)
MLQQLISVATELLRLSVWLLILAAFFAPVEKLWGSRPKAFFRRAFGTDLIYFFLSGFAPKLLLVIPLSLLARLLHRVGPSDYYDSVALLPFWFRLVAGLVVGEVGGYWGHRWCHEWPLLWRFHSVHHAAEEVDWLVNTRAHPVDAAFVRLCGLIPMYALGLAQPSAGGVDSAPVLLALIGTAWGFLIHANVKWRFGAVEWLVSTPAFHHWHHTNDSREVIDKNYAAMLPCIDKCFGTLYLPDRLPATYGISESSPGGIVEQLLAPFGTGGREFEVESSNTD